MERRALVAIACVSAMACAAGDGAGRADATASTAPLALEPLERPRWPAAGVLSATVARARPLRRAVIALDAGHGAPGNTGAISVSCQNEQDFTLRVSGAVAARLADRFEVVELRRAGTAPSYAARLEQAERAGAEALISFHFDARGAAEVVRELAPGRPCLRSAGSVGFAVLWSDEGSAALVARRHALARRVARALSRRGFRAYDGADYPGLYEGDAVPGVFVDRHVPGQRVFILRRSAVPAVIVETHHALHPEEWARWQEPATLEALAEALAEALSDGGG